MDDSTNNTEQQIFHFANPYLGGDPEFFLGRGGQIIGAEKVLKEGGKEILSPTIVGLIPHQGSYFNAFVLDGVQVELNPKPHSCRTNLGKEISLAFKALKTHLEKIEGEKIIPSFAATIELSQEELDSLSDQSKIAGCKPSENLYDGTSSKIEVDYAVHRGRSAGGHIHLGLLHSPHIMAERLRLIPILDYILAIPSVLIDRDPGNVERRKHYGRASEYRLPVHGLEYRTLSNFWLRSFPLTSFVMGQARLAVNILGTELASDQFGWEGATSSLLGSTDLLKVKEAINTNNLDLAAECWDGIKGWLKAHTHGYATGVVSRNLHTFDHFAEKVQKEGLGYWFPDDPLTHWCDLDISDTHGGWESFLSTKVEKDLNKPIEAEHPF